MGLFDGKVAIVTGAGRGIGRAEAMLLAAEGASVVVNDLGGEASGEGADTRPAQQVVDEIEAAGGKAAANYDNIAMWDGGEAIVAQAVDVFGGLDVLINNAGILRDKMSFNMSEAEWDAVIDVHLKGHFATSRFAASYWRQRSKETRRAGQRRHRQHVVGVRPLRQRRSGQLRRRQSRHRLDDDRHGARARTCRRARQCDRTCRPHPAHRGARRRPDGRRRKATSIASRPRTSPPRRAGSRRISRPASRVRWSRCRAGSCRCSRAGGRSPRRRPTSSGRSKRSRPTPTRCSRKI